MTIRCVGCGRAIRIPDDKAANPRLKVKCTCGVVFALAEAMEAAADSAAAERAVVAPASLTPVDTALTIDPSLTQPVEPLEPAAPVQPPPSPVRRTRPPGGWRRCINHHTDPSTHVCPKCTVGYCAACENKVRDATVCPVCEAFCVPVKKYEEDQELARQRQRSMMEELQTIATYPLRDPMGLVMLAVFTGVFGLLARLAGPFGAIGIVLSQGVLMWYCFNSLNRVANGNLKDFMPQFDDISDIVGPMKLGFAALVISAAPLFLIFLWSGISVAKSFLADAPVPAIEMSVAHAQPEEDEEVEEGPEVSGGMLLLATLLLIPAILWKLVYTPVALTVAALSRSILSTLNPVLGFDTIKRMGVVYWQAMLIYTVLAFGQWVLGFLLSFIPILGGIVAAFVDAYAYLAIGCTLGLAVFKKAPELGWD
jgi:hypothetical protein